jgi:hypothetical protein
MVSSYLIYTTICVPKDFIEEFNKFSSNYYPESDRDTYVRAYCDTGYGYGGIRHLNWWLSTKAYASPRPVQACYNNWRAYKKTGQLYDNCEKFHGSMEVLDYMIQKFFKPNGINLNGIVIGINDEYPHIFIYNVTDNEIELDEELTRKYLKLSDKLMRKDEDDDEDDEDDDEYDASDLKLN